MRQSLNFVLLELPPEARQFRGKAEHAALVILQSRANRRPNAGRDVVAVTKRHAQWGQDAVVSGEPQNTVPIERHCEYGTQTGLPIGGWLRARKQQLELRYESQSLWLSFNWIDLYCSGQLDLLWTNYVRLRNLNRTIAPPILRIFLRLETLRKYLRLNRLPQ